MKVLSMLNVSGLTREPRKRLVVAGKKLRTASRGLEDGRCCRSVNAVYICCAPVWNTFTKRAMRF